MDSRGANSLTLDALPGSQSPTRYDGLRGEIWIRTTAGASEGFGHLGRSLILARQLSPAFNPVFLLDFEDREARTMVAEHGWEALEYGTGRDLPLHRNPSMVLFDTRRTRSAEAVVLALRRTGIPVASVHDMGLDLLPSDLLIDGSILARLPESLTLAACVFSGPAYLVLDPSFETSSVWRRCVSPKIARVHISLGGGDSSGFFPSIVEGLRLLGRSIEVVAQAGFVATNRMALAGVETAPLRFTWANRNDRTSDLLAAADLAVTAGGLSAYEALAAGTPLLAVAHDKHQHRTISEMVKRRVCVDLGRGAEIVPAELARRVEALDSCPPLRQQMADSGRCLIDGRGVFRVVRLLYRLARGAALAPEGALP